jgi:hypothetical protein
MMLSFLYFLYAMSLISRVRVCGNTDGRTTVYKSKLSLVDLAGSEKMHDNSINHTNHVKELTSINKSLHCLGNVISSLSSYATTVSAHIPYRDSKLTRLLQDSLGGNTRTILIACIAPTVLHAMESINTLHFADRAKNVMMTVRANTHAGGGANGPNGASNAVLEAEIARLKMLLKFALEKVESSGSSNNNLMDNMDELSRLLMENSELKKGNAALRERIKQLEGLNLSVHTQSHAAASSSSSKQAHTQQAHRSSKSGGVSVKKRPSSKSSKAKKHQQLVAAHSLNMSNRYDEDEFEDANDGDDDGGNNNNNEQYTDAHTHRHEDDGDGDRDGDGGADREQEYGEDDFEAYSENNTSRRPSTNKQVHAQAQAQTHTQSQAHTQQSHTKQQAAESTHKHKKAHKQAELLDGLPQVHHQQQHHAHQQQQQRNKYDDAEHVDVKSLRKRMDM